MITALDYTADGIRDRLTAAHADLDIPPELWKVFVLFLVRMLQGCDRGEPEDVVKWLHSGRWHRWKLRRVREAADDAWAHIGGPKAARPHVRQVVEEELFGATPGLLRGLYSEAGDGS